MVHDDVWADAGMTPDGGMLCISCLEQRLGGPLVPDDLIDAPVNWPGCGDDTPRLARLKAGRYE
jgi:hypothetical protein